jgi:hypothetical protein
LNNASPATLSNYKVIILMGEVSLDDTTRPLLRTWVQNGGTLVANFNQIATVDYDLFGIQAASGSNSATGSSWVSDGTQYSESTFQFLTVTLTAGATALATSGAQPIITSNSYGLGRAILTLPAYLQDSGNGALLNIGIRLIDWLQSSQSRVGINGAPIEYIVNQGAGKTLVTLVNNGASQWSGSIAVSLPEVPVIQGVKEYVTDAVPGSTSNNGVVSISVSVPPFDLRVIAVQYDSSITLP